MYKRNIQNKLTSLRLLFIFYLVTGIIAYQYQHINLSYLVAVLAVFSSLIVIKDFKVENNAFTIIKFFFFGIIPVSRRFHKQDDIIVQSDGSGYGNDVQIPDIETGYAGPEILMGCLYRLIAKPKIGLIEFSFQRLKENGRKGNKIYIFLDTNEYRLAKQIFNKT